MSTTEQQKQNTSKVWFVTGASRGLGAEIARAALAAGHRVAATGRNPESVTKALGTSDNLLATALDVTDPAQVLAAVQAARERFGRIDVLVNNAGYGHLGVFEESTEAEVRAQFETNVFGLMAVTRAALPVLREQRSGHIFNISSIAGLEGVFAGSLYNASKFAVEGFSQAIAQELAPFGVHVTCVSPGGFRTDFLEPNSIQYSDNGIADYAKPLADFRAYLDSMNGQQIGDPKKLAAALLHLSEVENPPVTFVVGSDAVQRAGAAFDRLQTQLAAWRDLSTSTDGAW